MNERTLCQIWNSLRFRRDDLRDADGVPVQVVYRGRWQHGPGPDFRGALIARGGGALLHGDVELHLRTADWNAHRHQHDPFFNTVILHVVLDHAGAAPTLRQDGTTVPTLALAAHLPDAGAADWPDAALAEDEPCRGPQAAAGQERLGELLDEAGDARLRERVAAVEGDLAAFDPDEVIYRRLMDAMGYSQNREGFRELAERLTLAELATFIRRLAPRERVATLSALLLAAAGLPSEENLPLSQREPKAISIVPMRRQCWRLAGIRPANQPDRRIRAVAALLASHLEGGLARGLCLDWPQGPPRAVCRALRRVLLVRAADGEPGPRHLLGPGRAADVVVNVVLPFAIAYAELTGNDILAEGAWEAYRCHPRLSENEVTRTMGELLGGSTYRRIANSARRQQGLLHLFRHYCDYRRCAECPAAQAQG